MEAIETAGLTKHFGRVHALEDLDLAVHAGEIFGFLGPNGAGKSTTIRLLLGLIRPTRGRATILGIPVGDVERAHRHVGYVPGDVALWPQLTGSETLELLGNIAGHTDRRFRDELTQRLELDPSTRMRSYSKGNRQKVALVAALMGHPDVLLLDEPTAGLDPIMASVVNDLIIELRQKLQITAMVVTNDMASAYRIADRIGMLSGGKIIEIGTPDQIRTSQNPIVRQFIEGRVAEPTIAERPA